MKSYRIYRADSQTTQIVSIILEKARYVEDAELNPTTRLSEDLGIDSAGFLDIYLEIEAVFDIELSDADLDYDRWETIGSVVSLVQRYL